MDLQQLRCLVALAEHRHIGHAADACGASKLTIVQAVRAAEDAFGKPVVHPGPGFSGFTSEGEHVVAWARTCVADCDALRGELKQARHTAALAPLLARRSVSPKRLRAPGPDAEDIDLILQGALRAPDHGGLHPWRVLEFLDPQRGMLADLFESEKRRRDPLASPKDLRLAREHATRAPVLLGFIVSPRVRSRIPAREQWLAAGAALGNLLNAAHQLGYGAIVLSGERCFDAQLGAELGIKPGEFLAGFVSLGTVAEVPPPHGHAMPGEVWSAWMPEAATTPTMPMEPAMSTDADLAGRPQALEFRAQPRP